MKGLLIMNGIPIPSPPPRNTNDDQAPQDTEDVFEFSISTLSTVSSKASQQQERINVVRQTRRKKSGHAESTAHRKDQDLGVYMYIPIAFNMLSDIGSFSPGSWLSGFKTLAYRSLDA